MTPRRRPTGRSRRKPSRSRARGRTRFLIRSALFLTLLATLALSLVYLDVTKRFEARRAQLPSRLYSDSLDLVPGVEVPAYSLLSRLSRLGYRRVTGNPRSSGEYSWGRGELRIALREFTYPERHFPGQRARIRFRGKKVRRITDLEDGRRLPSARLEPELLATFYDEVHEERTWFSLKEFPEELRSAVLSVEDRSFFRHLGIDPRGILRALWVNIRHGRALQGGSTITQQLAKNLYAHRKRDLSRKLLETLAAVLLEARYEKDRIFESYLNEVYLGQRGPVAISGMGEASRFYFRKLPSELSLSEAALLAGMISSPGQYNPYRHPEQARERRNRVLKSMLETGDIDEKAYRVAHSQALGVTASRRTNYRAPYLVEFLEEEVRRLYSDTPPAGAGLQIFTTVDPDLQELAEESLTSGLVQLEKDYRRLRNQPRGLLQGALVALRPSDGAILALVGGRDYRTSQFNRTYQARRQPGSLFKTFVYLAGFDRAQYDPAFDFTAATLLEDAPLTLASGGKPYEPQNYDREFRGAITVRRALEESINVPTIRAALRVGLNNVITVARRCGIESRLLAVPSLALGTAEVSPLEMAAAYATIASGGIRNPAHALRTIGDAEGRTRTLEYPSPTRVLSEQATFLVTDVLAGVFARGTAKSAAQLGFRGVSAGKTGTTDDLRDAWFVGFNQDLLVLVWVGYDDNRPLGLTGAQAALPIWVDFMTRSGRVSGDDFSLPHGIVRAKVDPETGQLATWRCPRRIQEVFIAGTEPVIRCELHGKKRRWWWGFGSGESE